LAQCFLASSASFALNRPDAFGFFCIELAQFFWPLLLLLHWIGPMLSASFALNRPDVSSSFAWHYFVSVCSK
jgi:hypothetical protein